MLIANRASTTIPATTMITISHHLLLFPSVAALSRENRKFSLCKMVRSENIFISGLIKTQDQTTTSCWGVNNNRRC